MEQELRIPIPKTKKFINAKIFGPLDRPFVVFVHGLAGHMDEHLFYNGARFFDKHGFSSLRFNLYDWQDDARQLIDCTLETHAQDLDTATAHLRKQNVKKIIVVGHSYGGPTVLLSKRKDFDAAVLWDPSNDAYEKMFKNDKYIKKINLYRVEGGYEVLVGKEMHEESKEIDWDNLIQHIHVPIKIICAGKGTLIEDGKRYFSQANEPKEFTIIEGAAHNFFEEGALEKLLNETLSWTKKY